MALANPSYYEPRFRKFEENGGRFLLTWNWSAACFSTVWQMFRGLQAKALLYLLVFVGFQFLTAYAPGVLVLPAILILWIGSFFFYGFTGNYDYYLRQQKNEKLWPAVPYAKFKGVFWAFVALAAAVWLYYLAQGVFAMQELAQGMANPVTATGKTVESEGVRYAPTPGWKIVGRLPRTPGEKLENLGIFMVNGSDAKGEPVPGRYGQAALFVAKAGRGKTLESIDDPDVKKLVATMSTMRNNPALRFMPVKPEIGEPAEIDIGGKRWVRAYEALKFEGQDDGIMNLFYYAVGENKLLALNFSGSSGDREWVFGQMERFLATVDFIPDAAASPS